MMCLYNRVLTQLDNFQQDNFQRLRPKLPSTASSSSPMSIDRREKDDVRLDEEKEHLYLNLDHDRVSTHQV